MRRCHRCGRGNEGGRCNDGSRPACTRGRGSSDFGRPASSSHLVLLEAEARHAHAGHLCRLERPLPYVILKLAVSADEAIGRVGEHQVPVTGEVARRHVQALRARFDAILVGRGTVETDDPQLTVRPPGLEHRSPVRVVLDTKAADGRTSYLRGQCTDLGVQRRKGAPLPEGTRRIQVADSDPRRTRSMDVLVSLERRRHHAVACGGRGARRAHPPRSRIWSTR